MAQDNAIKFEELLRKDEALRAKLEAATAAYDGDKGDEKAVFEAVIAPLATEAGLPYTYEEGKEAASGRDLDDAELMAVAGGDWGFCILLGISDHPDAECREPGYACAYIGVGAGGEINE